MPLQQARFRFYAELNDFLPPAKRHVVQEYRFRGTPSIKDAVEALGVPHPEVDLVVVNGVSVGWGHRLANGDEVSVYPVFESLDISPIVRLRPEPLRNTRFVLDVHLGRLARLLRMLGFDTVYDPGATGLRIIGIASRDRRIILTRSRALLKDSRVTHGYWIRTTDPREQVEEVVERLHLRSQFAPFTRCMECNGMLAERPRGEVIHRVPPRSRGLVTSFRECTACGKLYWEGTHVERMRRLVEDLSAAG